LGSSDGRRYFTFVAQSLDNRSPDIISELGTWLSTEDLRSPDRVRIVGMTTTISARGKKVQVSDRSPSCAFVHEQDVLFHIGTEDKDSSGRSAPVLCLGRLGEPDTPVWPRVLIGELDEFAGQAGRTIGPRQRSDLVQLLDMVRRQPSSGGSLMGAVKGALAGARDKDPARLPPDVAAVMILGEADRRVFAADRHLVGLLNDPNVAIVDVPVPDEEPQPELVRRLKELGLLDAPPTLAVRDPYDAERYLPVDDLSDGLLRSKQGCYQILCQLLGAKTVTVEAFTRHAHTGGKRLKVGGSATIKGRGVRAAVGTETDDLGVMTERVELRQENVGAKADLEAAQAFIRDRQLGWDTDLVHLLDAVRHRNNPTRELRLKYSTRHAMDRVTRRVADIGAVGAALNAGGGKSANYETVYEFNVAVTF
jgi:hypothetical protein